ncbi:PREDICTED: alternative oxidase, mitochondrial-like [Amphimedon queenslandica]|uniref:Alternative oxidase n=1 Tax=Amphimedon queenslandica TaxID=400682 RepID=A0A1X7VAB9_AMPQE|nr:PREDICTED: alternative oxidase, mitochondrial-like [Amphimedon queenslandica]|eukprot:XP_003385247.1 PREDICTED: alternative oxidase, mitochondrial-like [Amphimedon queenslandica]
MATSVWLRSNSRQGNFIYTRFISAGKCHRSVRAFSASSNEPEEKAPHFKRSSVVHPLSAHIKMVMQEKPYTLPHPIWTESELNEVTITHVKPSLFVDKAAYASVQTLRFFFDVFSGYYIGKFRGTLNEKKWLTRIIFLETVAGVPGMIAAMLRHLRSLRYLQRDHGWIHTLLEEAENERMHLLTALVLRKPGFLFRFAVIGAQGIFVTLFSAAYIISPKFCHRFVGYLEEEAVKTYTHCLECIDRGDLKVWAKTAAPSISQKYWQLPEGAMMRDVILAIRADEAHHCEVNHTLSSMDMDKQNPFEPGK